MEINEVVVLIGILGLLAIMAIRLWNIMNSCKWIQNWRIVAVMFCGTLLSWFFVFLGSTSAIKLSAANIIYGQMMRLSNFMLMIGIVFLILEFALYSGNSAIRQVERT